MWFLGKVQGKGIKVILTEEAYISDTTILLMKHYKRELQQK